MITYILIWVAIGYISGIAAFIADYRDGVSFSIGELILMFFCCSLGGFILALVLLLIHLSAIGVFDEMKDFFTKPRIGKDIKK